jgi:energy-coupling factor transporter ATP-binding protein EcfA2
VKIKSIKAREVFSFHNIELTLDDTLTVLVGPNGAGKTNLARLLDIARTSVRWHATSDPTIRGRLDTFRSARRIGADRESMSIIDVELDLDQPEERDLISSFVRVAATTPTRRDVPKKEILDELLPWTEREITEAKLEEVFRGHLVVQVPRSEIDHLTGRAALGRVVLWKTGGRAHRVPGRVAHNPANPWALGLRLHWTPPIG